MKALKLLKEKKSALNLVYGFGLTALYKYFQFIQILLKDILNRIYFKGAAGPIGQMWYTNCILQI